MSKEDYELSAQLYMSMEKFYLAYGASYETQYFEKRKQVAQMFGDMVAKDMRTFKTAMVIIAKLKAKALDMHLFFVKLHRALSVFEHTYGENEKYLKFFKLLGPAHFNVMLSRIKSGSREVTDENNQVGKKPKTDG
jgi:hypothetical protein